MNMILIEEELTVFSCSCCQLRHSDSCSNLPLNVYAELLLLSAVTEGLFAGSFTNMKHFNLCRETSADQPVFPVQEVWTD